MFGKLVRWLPMAAICLLFAGCGSMAAVNGKVVFKDGTSPTSGEVNFALTSGDEGGINARGEIQDDGTFTLSTYSTDDGAPYGKYNAWISSCEPPCKEKYMNDAEPPFTFEITTSGQEVVMEVEKAE